MGRKRKQIDPRQLSELSTRRVEWVRWRWEFMRRDPQYQKAWREVQKLRKLAKYSPADREVTVDEFGKWVKHPYVFTEEAEKESEISAIFGLQGGQMINPSKSFEALHKQMGEKDAGSPRFRMFFLDNLLPKALRVTHAWYNSTGMETAKKNRIRLEIDFDEVNSLDTLKKQAIRAIDEYWDFLMPTRATRGRSPLQTVLANLRPDDFEKILQVGELRKKGLAWAAIESQAFEEDESPESAVKKAQQHHKRYEKLVSGGWRDLKP